MRFLYQKRLSEDELVEACLKRRSSAQKELYERYAPKMYAICLRYLKNESEAEDTMITAFMKVFQKIDQYQFKGSFEGWIRKIMVNEALSLIRKNKNMYLEVDIDKADTEAGFSDCLEEEDLLVMIQNLPIGYRTVFNLYAIEGYSHKEIADLLNINEGTSKSQLSRARSMLQKGLLENEEVFTKQTMNHE